MKFSEAWLREWVNPAISTEVLTEQLTMAGFEVESVTPITPQFTHVKVAVILACKQHPSADRLKIAVVDIGGSTLQIVCGAANCRAGIKVACATVGAVLPHGTIKAAELRGVLSEGMLCAYEELGLFGDEPGILELPDTAPVGENLETYLSLQDNLLSISITPNRGDCLSVLGIAREIAALNDIPLTEISLTRASPGMLADKALPRIVIAPDARPACSVYLGQSIQHIDTTAKTPWWMKLRLHQSDIRPIHPIVDITQYVMLELGQPLHAYDRRRCDGTTINVRLAHKGESVQLLHERPARLNAQTLVIADSRKILSVAGTLGATAAQIAAETTEVFLEAAHFCATHVSQAARQLNVSTEASYRFARGVDPNLPERALGRAKELILSICGGQPSPVVSDQTVSRLYQTAPILLKKTDIHAVIGIDVPPATVERYLQALHCSLLVSETAWEVTPPSFRQDLKKSIDLIEEIARLYGYQALPSQLPQGELKSSITSAFGEQLRCKMLLVNRGFYEVITYSFVDGLLQQQLLPEVAPLTLENPISQDMNVMRCSLLPGLLKTLQYQNDHQQHHSKLFELGLCFILDPTATLGVRQTNRLGLIRMGSVERSWNERERATDFFDIKGDMDAIFSFTRPKNMVTFTPANYSCFHPYQQADLCLEGAWVGKVGRLHPQLAQALNLPEHVFYGEVELAAMLTQQRGAMHEAVSRFPAVYRDLSLVIAESIPVGKLLQRCKEIGGATLKGIVLFDLYQGEPIPLGYKSLAIALTWQSDTHTLTEQEIVAQQSSLLRIVEQEFHAKLRDMKHDAH